MFAGIRATAPEIAAVLPGDELVPDATIVMDRAFSLPASPAGVWPWFVQLGKNRAGWYLPRRIERFVPAGRRALRHIEPRLQQLAVHDVIDDWGGPNASFTIADIAARQHIVHTSTRGGMRLSWTVSLQGMHAGHSRVQLRLRLAGVRHAWLARSAGGLLDILTVAGLAAGLRERLQAGKAG